MDKKTWIVLIVFSVFLFGYQGFLMWQKGKKPREPQKTQAAADTLAGKSQQVPAESLSQKPQEMKTASPAQPETSRTTQVSSPEDSGFVVVSTQSYTLRLYKIGGAIESMTLYGFKNAQRDADSVVVIKHGSSYLATWFDYCLHYTGSDSLFKLAENDTLRLEFSGPEGAKFYTFYGTGHTFSMWLEGPDTAHMFMAPSLAITEKDPKLDLKEHAFVYYRNDKMHREPVSKVKGPGKGTPGDGVKWFGLTGKYFMFACIVQDGALKSLEATTQDRSDTTMKLEAVLNKTPLSLTVYAGPIDYDVLKDVGYGLEDTYNFGFWLIAPFARFIFVGFRLLYKIIPNYGWVILLFSLLMKVVFSPLSFKMFKSMKKMQDLKPKMDALQKKYKDKPEELNRAIADLYKEQKVNPLSGCFPMLLQLPIFWALYQVLRTTIDLRAAPWIFWIQDLSMKDPYYILPVVMGAVSLANGLLQPQADKQAKWTSAAMAGVFTFIFLNFPAGIVLYWLSYNIYSIGEQYIFRRMLKKPEAS